VTTSQVVFKLGQGFEHLVDFERERLMSGTGRLKSEATILCAAGAILVVAAAAEAFGSMRTTDDPGTSVAAVAREVCKAAMPGLRHYGTITDGPSQWLDANPG
jgi:hypothetical protein